MLYSVRRELTGGSHWSEMVASCEETKFMFNVFRSNVYFFNDQSLHLDSKDAQVTSWVWQDRCVARLWLGLQIVADCQHLCCRVVHVFVWLLVATHLDLVAGARVEVT